MKYEQLWKDIETLCALRGPSGREAAVREYLIEQIKGHAEYEVDPLGNLLVRKKGKKPAKKVLQLSAHMDEVGFIITNIDEKGFLSFAPVGGVQPEVTGGRMVLVGDNAIPGMVGCKPVHLCDDKERSDPGKISNMKIDIGAKDKAEAEKAEKSWSEELELYQKAKDNFKADDFDEAEAVAFEVLDQTQKGIIVHGATDPTMLIYALGRNDAKLKEISAIKDPVRFSFALSKLEATLKVSTKKPATQPEGKIVGNARPSGTVDSTLARLREEANRTGDYTKVMAYKRSKAKA